METSIKDMVDNYLHIKKILDQVDIARGKELYPRTIKESYVSTITTNTIITDPNAYKESMKAFNYYQSKNKLNFKEQTTSTMVIDNSGNEASYTKLK